MALPLMFSNWWEELDQPHRLLDQHFGLGVHPEKLIVPSSVQIYGLVPNLRHKSTGRCPMAMSAYYRPWAELLRKGEGGASTVKADKNQFHVVLDVQQFAPEDINVKVVDRFIIVEAKHEEKQDEHGWISRQFSRRYMVPEQCDIEQVSSKLSSDGILSISVPRKEKPAAQGERVINIVHTGKPAISSDTEEPKKDSQEEKEST